MSLHLRQAPLPSARLRELVASSKPVALRRPRRELALYLTSAACLSAVGILAMHLRKDGHAVAGTLASGSLLWALAAVIGAWTALIPPPRHVLPSLATSRVGAVVTLALALATLATLATLRDSPRTLHPSAEQAVPALLHCERIGLFYVLPLVALGWAFVLRRMPVGGAAVGAAVGASSGAVGGFVLQLVCSWGGAAHALLGHVGVVVVGALAGALAGALGARR